MFNNSEYKRALTRLEYLRDQINSESVSYDEIAELQSLSEYIDSGDTLLLEWAGVPETIQAKTCRDCGSLFVPKDTDDTTDFCNRNCWGAFHGWPV